MEKQKNVSKSPLSNNTQKGETVKKTNKKPKKILSSKNLKKKPLFSPKKKSEKALEKEFNELKKSYQYLQAEFANYKRHTEKARQEISLYANFLFIQEFLVNVFNDFNQAMATSKENTNFESFKKGMSIIHEKFLKHLKKHGLEEISPEGLLFDPHFHEVLSTQVKKEVPENTILQVCKKGYKLHNRLVQPAQVIVSKKS